MGGAEKEIGAEVSVAQCEMDSACHCWLWRWKGTQAKGCQKPLEAGKGKEVGFPPYPPEERQAC